MREITGARAAGMTVGELSQLTGVNIETIRYYEKIKVLPAPSRAKNGRRVYGPTERRILAFVRRSRELEHFPGRSNRKGFPRRRESDSTFPLGQGGQL